MTANLSLEVLDASEFIDPEIFNRNFEKIDKVGKCYIVEAGTTGEWSYVKWSDGRAECWIDEKNFPNQTFKQWGILFSTSSMRFGAYPFAFSSKPDVRIEFCGCDDADNWPLVAKTSDATTTMPPSFCLFSPVNRQVTNPRLSITVKGRVS